MHAGGKWFVEPEPTEIEATPVGLVVSLLHGGENLAPGRALLVDPEAGETEEVATNFTTASNVAIGDDGAFVSELFPGRITLITKDDRSTFWEGPTPAAVEWHEGSRHTLVDVMNMKRCGKLVAFHPEPREGRASRAAAPGSAPPPRCGAPGWCPQRC